MPTPVDPKRIRTDLDTQSRVALNDDVVKEYAEAMEAGHEFPPPLIFYDETANLYILVDGFHRFAAHMRVRPNDPITVEMRLGTLEDARWESIGANKSHGLRRTNEDKRNAVTQGLLHRKGVDMSNRNIAAHIGVSEFLVRTIRAEMESTAILSQSETRTGRDGRTINTERIGNAEPVIKACSTCRYFAKGTCQVTGKEPIPFMEVCDDWEIKVADRRNKAMPPPDYDNDEIYDDTKRKKPKSTNPHQYRRLKGCLTLSLPPDNAQLFAIELRNSFSPDYLTACIAELKHLLLDEND